MLNRMRETLLAELQVPNASPAMLAELRSRAENIRELGGDHRLEAFIIRLARFECHDEDMESLAGMAVNKPPRDWVDPDIDRATVELAEMAQRFVHAESFARVKGRQDKRHAMAVVVGMEGPPSPLHAEFDVTDMDRPEVKSLIKRMDTALKKSGEAWRNIILAALAELSARYLAPPGCGGTPGHWAAPADGLMSGVATEWHVLGLSGGRDSAALAVYMRQNHPDLDIDYFFTDTGKELPEVYEFLVKLEGFLGKPILRLNPDRDFDFWLKQYNNFLPSAQTRWCTRQLKLRPFEQWIRPEFEKGTRVFSYVAIRSDEEYREGYTSKHDGLAVRLPFKAAGIDKAGVLEILDGAGLGLPEYYQWRTRSGCTFCFFQQKIEWVRLMERHPDYFEEAKRYEKSAIDHGSPFTWSQGESLDSLSNPERVAQIKENHEVRLERVRSSYQANPLRPDSEPIDIDDLYGKAKVCLACHK